MRRMRFAAIALASTGLVAGVLAANPVQAAAPAVPAARAADAVMQFSHTVPVDQQRPGFEPDVVLDSQDRVFTSVPNGSSTTESFLWSSLDHGKSYQLAPGNIGGKPETCVGGGDTELAVDGGDNLFFSDLQDLTNLSNSVSIDHGATWSTNCTAAPNTPVDRMWYAIRPGTKLDDGKFQIYEDYDAVQSNASANNALVETVSSDGVNFSGVAPTGGPNLACGGGAANCVTADEGISGNQVFSPDGKKLFIAHTDSSGSRVAVAVGTLDVAGTTATWNNVFLPNPPGFVCHTAAPSQACADPNNSNAQEIQAGVLFPVVAIDSAGHLYAAFASQQLNTDGNDPNQGTPTGPEQIWVSRSDDSGTTWSTPVQVSTGGTNTMPWMVAGDDGRVDVAWYHTDETSEPGPCASGSGTCTNFGPVVLTKAEWGVQMAQSVDASSGSPTYAVGNVTERPVKHGPICLGGLGCTTGGDRSLGDFLQVKSDDRGAAILSFVDDTSDANNGGEDTGPAVIVRQIGGNSLKASVGTIDGPGNGPGVAMDAVDDQTGDANYPANGVRTPAGNNLDLTHAGLSIQNNQLVVTIKAKDLSNLAVASGAGGSNAAWILRWTQVDPSLDGNGHIYYAGMESDSGGAPAFFDGHVVCGVATTHCKQMGFPATNPATGSVDAGSGTITINVPLPDIGNPAPGTTLYSAMAFTATSNDKLTNAGDPVPFNVTDATEPFNATVPPPVVPPGALGPSLDRAAPGCFGTGYWTDASDGGIFTFGDAQFFGSEGGHPLNKPVVGMAHTPSCKGYWLVATDGGIFTHGDAQFLGSTGSIALNKPIVGMAATPTGRGYWLVASDGGIFSFGDAAFYGSTGAIKLNRPIVAMARTNDGGGYYMVASDGGIFTFGNAPFLGSEGSLELAKPIVGMAVLTTAPGYWLVATDGGIFTHGNAPFAGSEGGTPLTKPMVGMTSD